MVPILSSFFLDSPFNFIHEKLLIARGSRKPGIELKQRLKSIFRQATLLYIQEEGRKWMVWKKKKKKLYKSEHHSISRRLFCRYCTQSLQRQTLSMYTIFFFFQKPSTKKKPKKSDRSMHGASIAHRRFPKVLHRDCLFFWSLYFWKKERKELSLDVVYGPEKNYIYIYIYGMYMYISLRRRSACHFCSVSTNPYFIEKRTFMRDESNIPRDSFKGDLWSRINEKTTFHLRQKLCKMFDYIYVYVCIYILYIYTRALIFIGFLSLIWRGFLSSIR